jgi:hypothetical protein
MNPKWCCFVPACAWRRACGGIPILAGGVLLMVSVWIARLRRQGDG